MFERERKTGKQTCWVVGIQNLEPFSREGNRVVKIFKALDGFIAVHPHYPVGNFLMFDSETAAYAGAKKLVSEGVQVREKIRKAVVDFDKGELIL